MDMLEVCRRAREGKVIEEESFLLDHVYHHLKQLVRKYNLNYNPDQPVPSNDALADCVFDAAVDFIIQCGIYLQDSQSVISISEKDIRYA